VNSYRFLSKLQELVKEKGWELETRRGATSHMVLSLYRDNRRLTALLPMKKGQDLSFVLEKKIIRNLELKGML